MDLDKLQLVVQSDVLEQRLQKEEVSEPYYLGIVQQIHHQQEGVQRIVAAVEVVQAEV